ncbi:MAG TPA: F0F1 ATP synthase subunit C [Salinisphaera sp.]|nr:MULTISPECIES: F0F1 ATP synthase subunit C [Salinisphaera]HET7313565.1 F0F1 ATP synthase subunit C [Salinisphaera sp.]
MAEIVAATAVAVGLMLAAAGLGSAIGWGLITSKALEGIARQPEMRPQLMVNMFIFAGLMESFPFILFGVAMWFLFANPFVGTLSSLAGGG